MKKAGYSIHWTGSGKEIAQAIFHCEQRIIQRLPFHSKEVDEEFYIQLNQRSLLLMELALCFYFLLYQV